MRKILFSMMIFILCFSACDGGKDDVLHLGINAEVVQVDVEHKILHVTMLTDAASGQKEVAIDCSQAHIIYCNYETHDVKGISFEEFQAGDAVILSIYESQFADIESGKLKVHQVQLATQRL